VPANASTQRSEVKATSGLAIRQHSKHTVQCSDVKGRSRGSAPHLPHGSPGCHDAQLSPFGLIGTPHTAKSMDAIESPSLGHVSLSSSYSVVVPPGSSPQWPQNADPAAGEGLRVHYMHMRVSVRRKKVSVRFVIKQKKSRAREPENTDPAAGAGLRVVK
jgi:hypothetical protein